MQLWSLSQLTCIVVFQTFSLVCSLTLLGLLESPATSTKSILSQNKNWHVDISERKLFVFKRIISKISNSSWNWLNNVKFLVTCVEPASKTDNFTKWHIFIVVWAILLTACIENNFQCQLGHPINNQSFNKMPTIYQAMDYFTEYSPQLKHLHIKEDFQPD